VLLLSRVEQKERCSSSTLTACIPADLLYGVFQVIRSDGASSRPRDSSGPAV